MEEVPESHLVLGGRGGLETARERGGKVGECSGSFPGKDLMEFSDFPKEKSGPRRTKKFPTDFSYP